MIQPHGGILINRYLTGVDRVKLIERAKTFPKIILDDKNISDLEMIASGAMSPLTGFMNQKDYNSVVSSMHLFNGFAWSIPINLAVNKVVMENIKAAELVNLFDHNNHLLATLQIDDIYQYNKAEEVKKVFGTEDKNHPGVEYVDQQ